MVAHHEPAEIIRNAVKVAAFQHDQEQVREAYRLQPDSAQDVDPWELPEEWKV